jgi:hypothetical protein
MEYFLCQEGHLFGPVVRNGELNEDEFKFPVEDNKKFTDPIPGRGLRVRDDGSNLEEIRAKLAYARPGVNSIHLHIWEDSYREFEPVRVAMERSGLKYAVLPWEPGVRLGFTDEPQKRYEQN